MNNGSTDLVERILLLLCFLHCIKRKKKYWKLSMNCAVENFGNNSID